jgi:hypothetical protein
VLRCMVLLNRKKTPAAREQDVATMACRKDGHMKTERDGTRISLTGCAGRR